MTRHRLTFHASIPTIAAVALAASAASAMPARHAGRRASGQEMGTHRTVRLPARVDATAHAATIRGIGVAVVKRAGE